MKRVYYSEKHGRVMEREGYATRIFWSTAMLDYLRRNFATTLNDDLAEWLGVSMRTMLRKARELGLEKDKSWLLKIWNERQMMAHSASKMLGYPGCFKKGEHRNPEMEYKPGRIQSDEIKRKQAESIRKWYRIHPDKAREKSLKAWETRRRRQQII